MDVLEKLKILEDFLKLEEFKKFELAYAWIDILKVLFLYLENRNEEFIKTYFHNFDFNNTHLYIKSKNKSIYFPQNRDAYIKILNFISFDIELISKKEFWPILVLNWIKLFKQDFNLRKQLLSLKKIERKIYNFEKGDFTEVNILLNLINRFNELEKSYSEFVFEYKNELQIRLYINNIQDLEIKKLLINRNAYEIYLLKLKIKLIKIFLDKWYNNVSEILSLKKSDIKTFSFRKWFNLDNNVTEFLAIQECSLCNYEYWYTNFKRALITRDFIINNIDKINKFDLIISRSNSELSHTAIIAREFNIPFLLWANWTLLELRNLTNIKIDYDKKVITLLK